MFQPVKRLTKESLQMKNFVVSTALAAVLAVPGLVDKT
jgi:hypothetical protein